jgi:protocatechuate 3,4-dioxygenase beta subunit
MVTRRTLLLGGAACVLMGATPRMTDGPFYPSARPYGDDADLVNGDVRGDRLHLAGRLLDGNGRPVAGGVVEIWQCDGNGRYLTQGGIDPAFQGFGSATCDGDGRFTFRTIVPVPYTGRTPHIHTKVRIDGAARLTSQLFLAEHPQNADDFLFRRLSDAERDAVSMTLRPRDGAARATYDTDITLTLPA